HDVCAGTEDLRRHGDRPGDRQDRGGRPRASAAGSRRHLPPQRGARIFRSGLSFSRTSRRFGGIICSGQLYVMSYDVVSSKAIRANVSSSAVDVRIGSLVPPLCTVTSSSTWDRSWPWARTSLPSGGPFRLRPCSVIVQSEALAACRNSATR